jgi:trehalose 6-phosphate phosphatase
MAAPNPRAPAIFPADKICLFLDLDGTLIEFGRTPREVRPDPRLVPILRALQIALKGAIALISGRRVEELDQLLNPLRLPAAGIHGLERRDATGRLYRTDRSLTALRSIRPAILEFVSSHIGLLLEDKGDALAVHYRRAPHLKEFVHAEVARLAAPLRPTFTVLAGDMVCEILPAGVNKATPVEEFMREPPFAGRQPVYVGDDITDCDGFSSVRRFDGITVAVGDRVTAQWQLADPSATRAWLSQIAGITGPAGK